MQLVSHYAIFSYHCQEKYFMYKKSVKCKTYFQFHLLKKYWKHLFPELRCFCSMQPHLRGQSIYVKPPNRFARLTSTCSYPLWNLLLHFTCIKKGSTPKCVVDIKSLVEFGTLCHHRTFTIHQMR